MSIERESGGPLRNTKLILATLVSMVPTILGDMPVQAEPHTETTIAQASTAPRTPEYLERKRPAVLVIHGWRDVPESWNDAVGFFRRQGYVVELLSLAGDDKSLIKDISALTLQDFQAAFEATCKEALKNPAIDPHDVTVLSHSFGGALAARLWPGCDVTRVVLLDPASYSDTDRAIPMTDRIDKPENYSRTETFRHNPDSTSDAIAYTQKLPISVLCIFSSNDDVVPKSVVVNYCGRPASSERSSVGAAGSREVKELVGAGHIPNARQKQELFRIVLDWIARDRK